jgi:uncharacterized iron-regulated membrane protein
MTTNTAPPGRSTRVRRLVRKVHRWLGLLIAIQVLCWILGGLVMSALRLDAVRGEHLVAKHPPLALDARAPLLPIGDVLQAHAEADITVVTLTTLLGQPVYRLETGAGPELVNAVDGRTLSPLPEEIARAVALADYAGTGALQGVAWIDTPDLEYRGRDLPLWRARFDDERDTTLYISPATGQVVARRNDLWRIFDFVWMLHIMDYQEREDFNHPLLVATAATALLFVLSGLVMLFFSFRPQRAG